MVAKTFHSASSSFGEDKVLNVSKHLRSKTSSNDSKKHKTRDESVSPTVSPASSFGDDDNDDIDNAPIEMIHNDKEKKKRKKKKKDNHLTEKSSRSKRRSRSKHHSGDLVKDDSKGKVRKKNKHSDEDSDNEEIKKKDARERKLSRSERRSLKHHDNDPAHDAKLIERMDKGNSKDTCKKKSSRTSERRSRSKHCCSGPAEDDELKEKVRKNGHSDHECLEKDACQRESSRRKRRSRSKHRGGDLVDGASKDQLRQATPSGDDHIHTEKSNKNDSHKRKSSSRRKRSSQSKHRSRNLANDESMEKIDEYKNSDSNIHTEVSINHKDMHKRSLWEGEASEKKKYRVVHESKVNQKNNEDNCDMQGPYNASVSSNQIKKLRKKISTMEEQMEAMQQQLRRTLDSKCDLELAQRDLKAQHEQTLFCKDQEIYELETELQRVVEKSSSTEAYFMEEIAILTEQLNERETKHAEFMQEKDMEISELQQMVHDSSQSDDGVVDNDTSIEGNDWLGTKKYLLNCTKISDLVHAS